MKYEFIFPTLSNVPVHIFDSEVALSSSFADWHFHEEFEVIWIQDGIKDIYINNTSYTLQKDDIIFINKNIPHKTQTHIGCKTFLLQFKHTTLKSVFDVLYNNSPSFYIFYKHLNKDEQLLNSLKKIKFEYLHQDKSYQAFIQAYIQEVMAILYRNSVLLDQNDSALKSNFNQIQPVLDYVNIHYAERISLDKICNIINVNKSYFCRLFKKIIGVSFVEYLNILRLNKAEYLLSNSDKSITEISYEVGFPSPSYFTELFHALKGHTPSFYKKLKKS